MNVVGVMLSALSGVYLELTGTSNISEAKLGDRSHASSVLSSLCLGESERVPGQRAGKPTVPVAESM